jgi:DNA-binding LacI/PurR family transcriptional regulator
MSDIAKITGFSIKTVSRVINNSTDVKPETRRKILASIEEHNFSVNIMAKALKTKVTKTIILFIDKHGGSYWNAWHSLIMMNIITDFKQRGYKVIISPSSGKGVIDDDTDGFLLLKSGLADGAVLFDNLTGDVRIKYLRTNNIPFVILGQDFDNKDTCSIDLDNYHVGEIGAGHLFDKGYNNISFFLGSSEFNVNHNRVEGFENLCKEKGLAYRVEYCVTDLEITYNKAKSHIKKYNTNAFFISGDEKILAVYKAIYEAGKTIPQDIGVLGIDNLPMGNYMLPTLSTIDQNVEKFAKNVVNSLIEAIQSNKRIPQGMLIKPILVERGSTDR